MSCYYSKANYYENYHLMIRVSQNLDANLKRFLWNGFSKSYSKSDLQTQAGFQSVDTLFSKLGFPPCKPEQPLRDIKLLEKETQKD